MWSVFKIMRLSFEKFFWNFDFLEIFENYWPTIESVSKIEKFRKITYVCYQNIQSEHIPFLFIYLKEKTSRTVHSFSSYKNNKSERVLAIFHILESHDSRFCTVTGRISDNRPIVRETDDIQNSGTIFIGCIRINEYLTVVIKWIVYV